MGRPTYGPSHQRKPRQHPHCRRNHELSWWVCPCRELRYVSNEVCWRWTMAVDPTTRDPSFWCCVGSGNWWLRQECCCRLQWWALLTAISMLEVPRQFAYVCIFYVTRTFRRTLNAYAISLVEGGSKSAATHNLIFFGLSLKGSLPILQKPTTAHSSHLL